MRPFRINCKGRNCFQVIIAISQLIAAGMNRTSMSQSLVTLKNYTLDDKGMKVQKWIFFGKFILTLYSHCCRKPV